MKGWPRWFVELADQEGGWLWALEPQVGISPDLRWAFWLADIGEVWDVHGDRCRLLGEGSLYSLEREAAEMGLIDLGGEA